MKETGKGEARWEKPADNMDLAVTDESVEEVRDCVAAHEANFDKLFTALDKERLAFVKLLQGSTTRRVLCVLT